MKAMIGVISSIGAALIVCLIFSYLIGENPLVVLTSLIHGATGNVSNLGYTLFYATPLIWTGLSVAVAFHAGLFNIGAEGQLYFGALVMTSFALAFPKFPFAIPLGIIASFIGGGFWGAIAGYLKAYRRNHEVIVTIMLNFISYAFCSFAILHLIKNPLSPNPESAEVGGSYFLSGLGKISETSPVNLSFPLALLTSGIVWFLLYRTTWGFNVRLCGASPETAKRSGVDVKKYIFQAMTISGGLAGLVAVNEVMGSAHKFRDQFSSGYGFMGIAVALLGKNRPLGIILAALVFGALQKGSLDLELDTERITRDLALIIEALIILFVASQGFRRRAS